MKCLQNKQSSILINYCKVNGTCMEPEYKNGDYVQIYKYSTSPKMGDIVFIIDNGIPKLHRIVNIKENKYFIKGDCSIVFDSIISENSIIGYSKLFDDYTEKEKSFYSLVVQFSNLIGLFANSYKETNCEIYNTMANNLYLQMKLLKSKKEFS